MSSPKDYEMVQIHDIASVEAPPEINSHDAPKTKFRPPPEFAWHNVDFKAGEKYILKECWGRVSINIICYFL